MSARISVQNVSRRFPTRRGVVVALDDVSLEVGEGEIVVLLGPSGCGKTTLLRCVAGLEEPDEGEIWVHGELVASPRKSIFRPPEARRLNMVFQAYALWPHLTVFANVAYPLKSRRVPAAEIQTRVGAMLAKVGCEHLADRLPGQLSGGQQQRVALARAIVANHGIVLFDEPLSNVDAKVREQLRIELLAMQRELRFSALYVTHDQAEATMLADRIAVMEAGRIAQIGSPREVYERPSSRYVADFIGAANVIAGVVEASDDGTVAVRTSFGAVLAARDQDTPSPGEAVVAMFRPEDCRLRRERGGQGPNEWPATLERALYLGFHTEYLLQAVGLRLSARTMQPEPIGEGDALWLSIDPARVRVLRA